VQVRGIIDNTPGNFGTTCTITTTPLTVLNPTSLRPNECGGTRALSGYVGAIIVAGIDGYVFNIYSDTIVPTLVASVSQASPYLTLSSVTPALSAGTTYFVRVQTRLDGNVSANNGSICPLIIAPATPRGMAGIAGGFNAAAYPNPFTTEVTLLTQNAAGYEVALKTLQQQFPYFIRDVSYRPLATGRRGNEGAGLLDSIQAPASTTALGARIQSPGRKDRGYVARGSLRPDLDSSKAPSAVSISEVTLNNFELTS
jgi:hypothetical protein